MKQLIEAKVHSYYWRDDLNCAQTTLKILSEIFEWQPDKQVLDAAIGLHGAGCYGAQCGLVEASLVTIGVLGKQRGLTNDEIAKRCYAFAKEFEGEFGSLVCSVLRPQGFKDDNPPHLCEDLTKRAILFSANHIKECVLES